MADEQRNLPAPSEKRVPPTPRLSSPAPIQTHGLTSERVAKIVSQSGSARMAALLGVDVNRTISTTFVVGAMLAAVAGTLYMVYYGVVNFADGAVPLHA